MKIWSLALGAFTFTALTICSSVVERRSTHPGARKFYSSAPIHDPLYWELRYFDSTFIWETSSIEQSFLFRSKFENDDIGASYDPELKRLWAKIVRKYPNLNCSFYDDEMETIMTFFLSNQNNSLPPIPHDIESFGGQSVVILLNHEDLTLENLIIYSSPIPTPKLSSELILLSSKNCEKLDNNVLKHLIYKALIQPKKNLLFFKSLCSYWEIDRTKLIEKIRVFWGAEAFYIFGTKLETLAKYENAQLIIAKRQASLYLMVLLSIPSFATFLSSSISELIMGLPVIVVLVLLPFLVAISKVFHFVTEHHLFSYYFDLKLNFNYIKSKFD